MLVYKVTNKINSKVYIGYTTKTLEERKKIHIYKSKHKEDKHYFYLFPRALRKYGLENFDWEVICICSTKEECCKKEMYYIKEYNTISPNGYNLTEGGNGGIQSEETKNKISKALKEHFKNNKAPCTFFSHEKRSEMSKKAWITKKNNGYNSPSGFIRMQEERNKMSATKNEKNKLKWKNVVTGETTFLSLTKMAEYTGLTIGTFGHLKHKRILQTKCGWVIEE